MVRLGFLERIWRNKILHTSILLLTPIFIEVYWYYIIEYQEYKFPPIISYVEGKNNFPSVLMEKEHTALNNLYEERKDSFPESWPLEQRPYLELNSELSQFEKSVSENIMKKFDVFHFFALIRCVCLTTTK
jgi:hypothetical protein